MERKTQERTQRGGEEDEGAKPHVTGWKGFWWGSMQWGAAEHKGEESAETILI